jgi:hypothetical protein
MPPNSKPNGPKTMNHAHARTALPATTGAIRGNHSTKESWTWARGFMFLCHRVMHMQI